MIGGWTDCRFRVFVSRKSDQKRFTRDTPFGRCFEAHILSIQDSFCQIRRSCKYFTDAITRRRWWCFWRSDHNRQEDRIDTRSTSKGEDWSRHKKESRCHCEFQNWRERYLIVTNDSRDWYDKRNFRLFSSSTNHHKNKTRQSLFVRCHVDFILALICRIFSTSLEESDKRCSWSKRCHYSPLQPRRNDHNIGFVHGHKIIIALQSICYIERSTKIRHWYFHRIIFDDVMARWYSYTNVSRSERRSCRDISRMNVVIFWFKSDRPWKHIGRKQCEDTSCSYNGESCCQMDFTIELQFYDVISEACLQWISKSFWRTI